MSKIVASNQITLIDLNDAIKLGTPPKSPTNETLWIDTSVTPNILKKWNGSGWVVQNLSLDGLDPTAATNISNVTTTLSSLSNDNVITKFERGYVKDKVTVIIGYVITDTANMPVLSTLDLGSAGEVSSVRKEAIAVGILATDILYTTVGTAYTNLANYLNGLSVKPWNTTSTANIAITPTEWRDKWLKYYEAVHVLRKGISDKLVEADSKSLKIATPYNNVQMDATNGLVAQRSDNKVKTTMNATDGFKIEKSTNNGSTWEKTLYADTNGVIYANGLVIDSSTTVSGTAASTVVGNASKGNEANTTVVNNKSTWDKASTSVQQSTDYNGVVIDSKNGIKVTSSKNVLLMNATTGLSMKKTDGTDVFKLDSNGNLSLTGTFTIDSGSTIGGTATSTVLANAGAGAQAKKDLEELSIGGRNLFRGQPTNEPLTINVNNQYYLDYLNADKKVPIVGGETYTFSADVEVVSSSTPNVTMMFSVGYGQEFSPFSQDFKNFSHSSVVGKYKIRETFVMPSSTVAANKYFGFRFARKGAVHTSSVIYSNIKLEIGHKATDWTPAVEDSLQFKQNYNGMTFDQTDGLSVTTARNTINLNAAKGIEIKKGTTSVFSVDTNGNLNLTGNIAMAAGSTLSADYITSGTINAERIGASSITAGHINSLNGLNVGNGNLVIDGTGNVSLKGNITMTGGTISWDKVGLPTSTAVTDTRTTNELPSWYYQNYKQQVVSEFKNRASIGAPGTEMYGTLTTTVPWVNTSGGSVTQQFASLDGVYYRQGNSAASAWTAWSTSETTAGAASKAAAAQSAAESYAALLSKAMAQGKILHKDSAFRTGANAVVAYGTGVTVTRVAKPTDAPTTSGYVLEVKVSAASSPGWGGVYQPIMSRPNAKFVFRVIAKIPVGYTVHFTSNSLGTGSTTRTLSDNKGTGKYTEYIALYECGDTGTFSTCGFMYISNGVTPTASAPLIWQLAYATSFDITDMDYTLYDVQSLTDSWKYTGTTQINGTSIYTQSITANQIKTGTITANEIATGTITANEIKAGTITSNEIKAGAITADKIAVGDFTNYADRSLYDDFISSAPWSVVTNIVKTIGGKSLKLSATTTDFANITMNNSDFPVVDGDQLYCEFWAYRENANQSICINIVVTGPDGTKDYDSDNRATAPATATNAKWIKYSGVTKLTKDGTAKIEVKMPTANDLTGNWYISDVVVRRAYTGSMIVDGTITANQMATMKLSAISADLGNINAGIITGVTISGSEFKSNYTRTEQFGNIFGLQNGTMSLTGSKIQFNQSHTDKNSPQDNYTLTTQFDSEGISYIRNNGDNVYSYTVNEKMINFGSYNPNYAYNPSLTMGIGISRDVEFTVYGAAMKLYAERGFNFEGRIIQNSDSEHTRFNVATHGYVAWYRNSTRIGYAGFGSNGTTQLTIRAEGVAQLNGAAGISLQGGLINTNNTFHSGVAYITPSAANTPTGKVVSWNAMASEPKILLGLHSSLPGTNVTGSGFSGNTTTGATIYVTRTNTTATNVNYLCVATK